MKLKKIIKSFIENKNDDIIITIQLIKEQVYLKADDGNIMVDFYFDFADIDRVNFKDVLNNINEAFHVNKLRKDGRNN